MSDRETNMQNSKKKVGLVTIIIAVLALLGFLGLMYRHSFGGPPPINAERRKEINEFLGRTGPFAPGGPGLAKPGTTAGGAAGISDKRQQERNQFLQNPPSIPGR